MNSFKLIKVGVVFVFAIAQALWLARYATPRPDPDASAGET